MADSFEILGGEYVARPTYRSPGALIAEVLHAHRVDQMMVFTPVAHLSAFARDGSDMTYPHWRVRLFVRSDIRYEAGQKLTTVVSDPERRAGSDRQMLRHLEALRDSSLPTFSPELPLALGSALIAAGVIASPAVVHVHSSDEQSFTEFGTVFHDDDA